VTNLWHQLEPGPKIPMDFLYLIQVKVIRSDKQLLLTNGKDDFQSKPIKRWLFAALLFVMTLACMPNTPAVSVATPPPTRTPLPTFTPTPLPPPPTPIPTHTNTPIHTDTPIPTPTPIFTDTPLPASTNTPVPPTNTPVPTAVPPTNTPAPTSVPTPTSAPTAASPLATPTHTSTPLPGTPPGRYEIRDVENEKNCAHVAVYGRVTEKSSGRPVQYVTIEVTGDEDPFEGPFIGKTSENGDYSIVILSFHDEPDKADKIDGVDFEAEVTGGPNVESEDKHEWKVSDDCEESGAIQVVEINWMQKR
jgi:hypothetical protein